MKVIVTGGAGFIGSHLVDALLEKGFEVHVIDNLLTGKRENINPAAVFHQIDIRDFEEITPLFQGARFVFHTAARPRVQPSIKNPRESHDINVNGTLNVLVAARDAGVKRVIYSASSSAYGNQERFPLHEDMTPMPLNPYGLQKYIGELKCKLFSQVYNLETVCLRYFSIYGPRAMIGGDYCLVMGRFLEQKKNGEPLTIVPDGTQSRNFTHVSDAVSANILAAESPKVGRGEVINIAARQNCSINELADFFGGPRVFIEPRQLEIKHAPADISRAKELINWEPQVKLEDGVNELKAWWGVS